MADDDAAETAADDGARNVELAAARAEVERLEGDAAAASARAEQLAAECEALRGELAGARDVIEASTAEAVEWERRSRDAAARYREAVVRDDPAVAFMVQGDTIEEIDASLASARETMQRVRDSLDERGRMASAPAGAPPRSAPDISAMSPAEKIRYGLAQQG